MHRTSKETKANITLKEYVRLSVVSGFRCVTMRDTLLFSLSIKAIARYIINLNDLFKKKEWILYNTPRDEYTLSWIITSNPLMINAHATPFKGLSLH